ncbi:MAG: 3-deoxy-D-manno-octulosonic acid transferase [Candidatus Pelagibacter sp.]
MFIVYNLLNLLLLASSPLILLVRLFLGKEDKKRFKEKFCLFSKRNNSKETIWIHGASVGEILSVIPIIKALENDKKIKKILLTSSTTSSASVILKYKFKKTVHQYYPLDVNFLTKFFISYWKPKIAIFIESEVWPNMYKNLYRKKIPLILLNARITNKSFNRWKFFPNFSKKIFNKITLALPQNNETKKYLQLLGVKNIKIAGNLKYFGNFEKRNFQNNLKNKFYKRNVWCAASTHNKEEIFIGRVHSELKSEIKNLITIIIPRHINRRESIINEISRIGLKYQLHSENRKIKKNTDIYLVDTYGEAIKFYLLSKLTFLGGSVIKHGGQNPLEPAREGNYILHGPNISNFKEVYEMLSFLKIAKKINSIKEMKKIILKRIDFNQNNKVKNKLKNIGKKILSKNLLEIKKFI